MIVLRMYPTTAITYRTALRNTVLPTSLTLSDHETTHGQPVPVPKGTKLFMSFYTLHRNEKVYGPDVESCMCPLPSLSR